jgi:hypothetical protein
MRVDTLAASAFDISEIAVCQKSRDSKGHRNAVVARLSITAPFN